MSFLTVFCQICLLYILCRFSPQSTTLTVSIKYSVTYAVLVQQLCKKISGPLVDGKKGISGAVKHFKRVPSHELFTLFTEAVTLH